MPTAYSFERYDSRGWKDHLAEEGFAVVRGVVSPTRCNDHIEDMRNTLQKLSNGKLSGDPASWGLSGNYPFLLHGGMVQYLGHTQFQWESRAEMAPVFSEFWGTDDLCSSFDGFCYMDARRRFSPRAITSFLHTDQSPQRDGLWSIQGALNLAPSGPSRGGFVVVPKSHRWQRKYFEDAGRLSSFSLRDNWYLLSETEKQQPAFQDAFVVEADAGDAILWDSRAFHCNTTPTQPATRAVVYVCMIPRDKVPPHIAAKRREAFEDRRCTAHHPGDGFRIFPRLPRFGSLDYEIVLSLQEPVLTPEMRALI
jgi:hypothetical protein